MRNLEGRDPIEGADDCFMVCIKCANINAMAGKSRFNVLKRLSLLKRVGLKPTR